MARPSKKSVYERIEDKKNEITKTEELLEQLNDDLQELFKEKDKLEMELLLAKVRERGLNIDQALLQLSK